MIKEQNIKVRLIIMHCKNSCSLNYQFYDHLLVDSPVSSETALKESSSFKDSLITVTAQIPATTLVVTTKTVSDNLEKHQTSTVTPTTTTVIKNTVATATTKTTMKAAMKTTTSTTTAAITTSRKNDTGLLRTLITDNPFLSRSLMTTGRFGITQTLAVTIPSVIIEASGTNSSQPGKRTPEDMVCSHPLTNQCTRGTQRRFSPKCIENTFQAIQSTFRPLEIHSNRR